MNEKSNSVAPSSKKTLSAVNNSLSDDRKGIFVGQNNLRFSNIEESQSRLRATPLKVCHASNVKVVIEEPATLAVPRLSIKLPTNSSKASTIESLGALQDANTKPRSRLSSLMDGDQLLDQMIQEFGGGRHQISPKISGNQLNMFRIVSRSGKKSAPSGQTPMSMNLDKPSNTSMQLPDKKVVSSKTIPLVNDMPQTETNGTKSLPNYYMGELFGLALHFHKGRLAEDLESESQKEFWEHYRQSMHTLRGMSSDTLTDSKEFLRKVEIRYQMRLAERDISPQTSVLQKPLLVLDLDETLIHKPVQGKVYREDASDLEMKCFIEKDPQGRYFTVYKRPYLQEFLQDLAEYYTIYVFTASEQRYAAAIVNAIDPERKYISRVFDRRFCCTTNDGYLVKDLRIFSRETALNKILLVDNSSHCFFTQLKNGVPILSFYDQKEDRELLHLKRYLQALSRCDNMLIRNEEHFQMDKYFTSGKPEIVLQKISSIKKYLQSGRK